MQSLPSPLSHIAVSPDAATIGLSCGAHLQFNRFTGDDSGESTFYSAITCHRRVYGFGPLAFVGNDSVAVLEGDELLELDVKGDMESGERRVLHVLPRAVFQKAFISDMKYSAHRDLVAMACVCVSGSTSSVLLVNRRTASLQMVFGVSSHPSALLFRDSDIFVSDLWCRSVAVYRVETGEFVRNVFSGVSASRPLKAMHMSVCKRKVIACNDVPSVLSIDLETEAVEILHTAPASMYMSFSRDTLLCTRGTDVFTNRDGLLRVLCDPWNKSPRRGWLHSCLL